MTNIDEVMKEFNERFYNDFDGRPCFTNTEIKSFIEKVRNQALEEQKEKVKEEFMKLAESYVLESYIGAGKIILNKAIFWTLIDEKLK